MKLTREQFVGRWRNAKREIEFLLRDDGTAHTSLGEKEHYPGTWGFFPPHQLLVRAVIPLNDPEIDDELNAHEMCYQIRTFSKDAFTAEEFDMEGTQRFKRKED
jgi:hypothetical protein